MRRGLDDLGVCRGFFRDRPHGIDEQVTFLFGFGFRRFDHQRARHDQWKRRRVGMEAVVDQPLGDVHRVHAVFFLDGIAEDDLVHRG